MALSLADNILRAVNFAFLVIILGLTGSLIATEDAHSPRVNFVIFAAAFGLVFDSFYGVLANFFSFLAWPLILVILDFLNFTFTFAGATALAVGIRTHSCTNKSYLDANSITQGSTQRCREAQTVVAFLYFSFFIFLVSLVLSGISLLSEGAFGSRISRPRTGIPTISHA